IITTSLQHPALLVNEDSLATPIRIWAPENLITIRHDLMAHGSKGLTHLRGNSSFECHPLPAQNAIPRCFERFLHIHAKIDHVECDLYVALDLHITTHDTITEPWPLILQDHRWDDGLEGPLARRQNVRVIRINDKTGPAILQANAGVSSHYA